MAIVPEPDEKQFRKIVQPIGLRSTENEYVPSERDAIIACFIHSKAMNRPPSQGLIDGNFSTLLESLCWHIANEVYFCRESVYQRL